MGTLDILTKGLAAKPFQSITNKLRIKNIYLPTWGEVLENQCNNLFIFGTVNLIYFL